MSTTVLTQHIDRLSLNPDRPLIVSDADEVLVQFARPLERFLHSRGLYLDLSSFRLSGNIRDRASDEPVAHEHVPQLIADFFDTCVADQPAVDGAAEALARLSVRAQVVVLSNVPEAARAAREAALARLGMAFPVLANQGLKGPAVKAMAEGHAAPVVFLDDIPHNIASVAEHATHVHRIHFVADPRLAALIGPAEQSHHRIDDWPTAARHIDDHLTRQGW